MKWIDDDCGICADAEGGYALFTILQDGTLEIRGPAWKKRHTYPKLDSQQQAIRVAERLAQLIAPTGIIPTASDPAGTTPAAPPAHPPAGRQQPRQRKEPL